MVLWNAVLLLSCGQTRPCKEGTALVAVTLEGDAVQAASLRLRLDPAAASSVTGTVAHEPGKGGGTIEVVFDGGYPADQRVRVSVTALDARGAIIAVATTEQQLTAGCSRLEITVSGTGNGGTDAAIDMTDGGDPAADASADRINLGDVELPTEDGGTCPGICKPGQELACGKCGKQVCGSDCTWSPCQSEGICAAGESRTCANCGTEFCNNKCQWAGCAGSKTCAAGSSEACGNCGLRTCSAQCEWGSCQNDGACMPGQSQTCGKCGVRKCLSGGTGCGWGTCEGEGVCSPGATEACGNCGKRTCLDGCTWSACSGEGVCRAGAIEACGNCGTRTCSSACGWGTCGGQGVCKPGDTADCGKCSDGVSTCSSSCSWGTCRGGSTICCLAATQSISTTPQAIIICPVPL